MIKKHLEKTFAEETIRRQQNYYRLDYSYTRNPEDALDIIQESIYKALSSLDRLKDPSRMKTWFYRILFNTCLDFLRKHRGAKVMDETLLDSQIAGKEESYPDIDLQKAITGLPPMYRDIIVLHYLEDLTIEEVSAILDVNESALNEKYLEENKKLYEDFMADISELKKQDSEAHMGIDTGYEVKADNERIFSIGRYVLNIAGSSSTVMKYDTIDKKNQVLSSLLFPLRFFPVCW